MKKTARGFTLVEVLITLLIIGVLSGLIYLALRPSEDMVKRKACEGNRSTILLALDAHRFSSGLTKAEYGLQSFIDEGYKNEIDNKETKCPAGGTYSAALSNGREIVVCSVHGGGPTGGNGGGGEEPGGGDEPGGGENGDGEPGNGNDDDGESNPSSQYIPNTDVSANDSWIEKQTVNDAGRVEIHFNQGEKFLYNNEYYVAISNLNEDFANTGTTLAPEDLPPNRMSESGYGLVRVLQNEPVIVWENLQIGDTVKRGNILLFNGEYYLCMVPSARGPVQIKFQYYNLGPNEDSSLWFKLNK